jgi:hypothetical protein
MSMTAETAPWPERQARTQDPTGQTVRYGILLAAVAHTLLHDHRFHAAVIMRAMGTVALASLIKNNQARPVRRFVHWYDKLGASQELARARSRTRRELAGAGQALERDNRS